jgi:hypothetical protein
MVAFSRKTWCITGTQRRRSLVRFCINSALRNSQTLHIESRAIKDIVEGEELLTEYADTTEMTRNERQKYLRRHYNFECRCAACMLPDEESMRLDEQLTTLTKLLKQVEKKTPRDGLENTKLINQILHITEVERIPSGCVFISLIKFFENTDPSFSRAKVTWSATLSAVMHSE